MAAEKSMRGYSRKNNVYIFHQFLQQQYFFNDNNNNKNNKNHSRRNKDIVVLDVAGGAGKLSWLIENSNSNTRSVILDPVASNFNQLERSLKYLQEHPDARIERSVMNSEEFQGLAFTMTTVSPRLCHTSSTTRPAQIPIHVDKALTDELTLQSQLSLHNDNNNNYSSNRSSVQWRNYIQQALVPHRATDKQPNEKNSRGIRVTDPDEILVILNSASLIVGLHPDQATDAILDLAAILQIPFIICPCCVFPSEFPYRRLKSKNNNNENDDVVVRTYDQLVKYLQARALTVCNYRTVTTLTLKFVKHTARNIVIHNL